jgi:hypothetical protein
LPFFLLQRSWSKANLLVAPLIVKQAALSIEIELSAKDYDMNWAIFGRRLPQSSVAGKFHESARIGAAAAHVPATLGRTTSSLCAATDIVDSTRGAGAPALRRYSGELTQ